MRKKITKGQFLILLKNKIEIPNGSAYDLNEVGGFVFDKIIKNGNNR
jgi:hypothetical protein